MSGITRYIILGAIFLLSLGTIAFFHYFPVSVISDVAGIPAIGSLVGALFLLFRDSIAFDRSVRIDEAKNRFTVGAMSHMADVAFDKNVTFCEKYAAEVYRTLVFMFRKGPHVDVLQNAHNLVDIRKEWAVWLNAEIETQLEKFETALRRIGANAHLLDALRADEDRTEAIREAYGTFAAVMGWETFRGEVVTGDVAAEKTIKGLRDVLGTGDLIRLRTDLVKVASDNLRGVFGMQDRMQNMEWKRPLIKGTGWGIGTAVTLVAVIAGFLWYQSRPRLPKPWNTAAIKAEFDQVDTEGDKNTLVFFYTLENTTALDYRIENDRGITVSAKLKRQNALTPLGEGERIDYPIFVPSKKRVRIQIHFPYPYSGPKADVTAERRKYQEAVTRYVATELPNLDGFDILDETNRYEIVLPAEWKSQSQSLK